MYMDPILIAPCGFNCRTCAQYQKVKNPCKGCHLRSTRKSEICILKNCKSLSKTDPKLCAGCTAFPCRRLQQFDQRYQNITGGYLSVIQNLQTIQQVGMETFLQMEEEEWSCPVCHKLLCVHSNLCPHCGKPYRKPSEKDRIKSVQGGHNHET